MQCHMLQLYLNLIILKVIHVLTLFFWAHPLLPLIPENCYGRHDEKEMEGICFFVAELAVAPTTHLHWCAVINM